MVYLHSQEPPIIHRDIKPSNIIRNSDGKVFLVDFGAGKNTYYTTLTGSSTVVGTFGYLAPEQFRGQAVTASDLYSLGVTILFLLTHISPTELSPDGLQIEFRSRVNISDAFADWLEIVVEPEVENRFKDVREALAVLTGNKKNNFKTNNFNSKTALIGTSIAVFGLLILLNSYKWAILSRWGIVPYNICNPKVMTRYLKQGGDPNAWVNNFADSYPIVDCFRITEDIRLLEYFVKKGGNIDYEYWGYTTVLNEVRNPKNALILFQYNQKRTDTEEKQRKEIALSLLAKSKEITLFLIDSGIDIHTIDDRGNTILHLTKDTELMSLAIEKGIDINRRNHLGQTPLHSAIEQRILLRRVEALLKLGANINIEDNLGQTPLEYAKATKSTKLINLLKKYDSNVQK